MPFTVITLKKVPSSLRGELSRWMQEISIGVYVGNYNAKVREYLWSRVKASVDNGEATISYYCSNEIGYSFCTYNAEREVIDYDGIPLVLVPQKDYNKQDKEEIYNVSDVSKFRYLRRKVCARKEHIVPFIFLDIETTGLNEETDQIIEIGAIKVFEGKETKFNKLIRINIDIPMYVQKLTGISTEMLRKAALLEDIIYDLHAFIKDCVLVGYNIAFDIKFLNKAFIKFSLPPICNEVIELINEAKKRNSFQSNYKFETTLMEYGIEYRVLHRALEDAELIRKLYHRMEI